MPTHAQVDSEKELIKRLQNPKTQQAAFRELVETYQERLYWHIRHIVLNHDDADDILQNSFIKIWRNINAFRGESSLYTWMFKIATNESITYLSQLKKQAKPIDNEKNEFMRDRVISDAYFDGDEIEKLFQEAIAILPQKQRLVFNMKYFEEKKYTEMSEILDTSVGALKASYHLAVKKIEEFFNNKE